MHRRHQYINIPTELIRSLVAIVETGSFTKAGERLGLSQPAISSQMRRLQLLVGNSVFEKVGNSVTLNARGKIVLEQGRKLLEANDRILSLAGAAQDRQPIRVGLASAFVERGLAVLSKLKLLKALHIHCENSSEIQDALREGYVDVAVVLFVSDFIGHDPYRHWEEELAWVRSKEFLLSPGAPVPLVSWPSLPLSSIATKALDQAEVHYRIVFATPDRHARRIALEAGVGIGVEIERQIGPPLTIAKDYYLPPLPRVTAGVCIAAGADRDRVGPIADALCMVGKADAAISAA